MIAPDTAEIVRIRDERLCLRLMAAFNRAAVIGDKDDALCTFKYIYRGDGGEGYDLTFSDAATAVKWKLENIHLFEETR